MAGFLVTGDFLGSKVGNILGCRFGNMFEDVLGFSVGEVLDYNVVNPLGSFKGKALGLAVCNLLGLGAGDCLVF